MTILPISQDNKGRFNRRIITLTGKVFGYDKDVFEGVTDTGKKVYIHPIFANTVGIRYTSDDYKLGYEYCSSLGWKNQYKITQEELGHLTTKHI